MKTSLSTLVTAMVMTRILAAPAPASEPVPTTVIKRADVCGNWDTISASPYIMYNDQWGTAAATSGSQCTGVDSINGTTIKWHTSWTWVGGPYSVKSFAQIYDNVTSAKQISAVSAYPSSWSWTYTGNNIVADVAYDIFTSSTTTGSHEYEIMIWLAALGGAGPIGSSISTVTIGSYSWTLYYGLNGSMKVYSFVASSPINEFSGDLKAFFSYLATNQGYPTSQYVWGAAAGTEPFTGTNALLTSTYTAQRN